VSFTKVALYFLQSFVNYMLVLFIIDATGTIDYSLEKQQKEKAA